MHDTTHSGHGHGAGWARMAAPLILCCWGAVFLAFFARGELAAFVAPFFRPLIAAAGVALTSLGLILCFLPPGAAPCCHGPDGEHDHDHDRGANPCHAHGHDHGERLSWPLVVRTITLFAPLALLFWVRPEGFSATTIRNRGILREPPPARRRIDGQVLRAGEPRPAEAPPIQMEAEAIFQESQNPEQNRVTIQSGGASKLAACEILTVYDVVVASADSELRQRLSGSRVRVLGQVVRDSKNPARFDLVRMFIVCCAADARVLGLKTAGGDISSMDEMAWVEVEGRLEFEAGPGIPQPLLRAERVAAAEEPDEPFLY